MKDSVRNIFSFLLAAVFLVSVLALLRQKQDAQTADDAYESARQLAQEEVTVPTEPAQTEPSATEPVTEAATEPTQPSDLPQETVWIPAPVEDDPYMKILGVTNLTELRKINSDLVGWIRIPDTQINFPVVQTDSNTYYLEHAWDGTKTVYGAIFLEKENDPSMTEFNTIIYGHNMPNGTMFAGLHDFADADFAKAHPYVYLVTDEGVLRYEVFSSYHAAVDSCTYGLSFRQEETRADFIETALENSQVDMGITPAVTDRILTLSTCTGMGYSSRRVVHARLAMIEVPA